MDEPARHRVPDRRPNVPVRLGSAHPCRFASVLGRIAAELAVDGSKPSV